MRILARLIVGFICSVAIVGANAAGPSDRALQQAATLVERMKVFDAEGISQLTYTRMFERMGIDPERPRRAARDLNEKLRSVGTKYTKLDLGIPETPFAGDGNLYIIIPYSGILEAQGHRVLQEAFFIGVSEDGGENWKFVDGISSTQDNIRVVIPSYSGKPLPPRRMKPLD